MILVTGGCGYIGSHVVKALSEAGEQVVVYDNLSAGRSQALLHNETLIVGDITDADKLEQVLRDYKVDTLMHFAALVNAAESVEKRDEYIRVNELGTKLVWESCVRAGVQYALFASSAAVYGVPSSSSPLSESTPLSPTNPYGASKVAGEESLRTISAPAGMRYGIFRFFNVAGAETEARLFASPQNNSILTRLFAAVAGKVARVTISGADYDTLDGTVVRDFVHVEDIARAHLLALPYLRQGGESCTLNLGSGRATSIKQLIAVVETITDTKIQVEYGPRITGDISYSLANIEQAQIRLGWSPQKSIEQIVGDAWKAYHAQI